MKKWLSKLIIMKSIGKVEYFKNCILYKLENLEEFNKFLDPTEVSCKAKLAFEGYKPLQ
jgi:hypothetical protein